MPVLLAGSHDGPLQSLSKPAVGVRPAATVRAAFAKATKAGSSSPVATLPSASAALEAQAAIAAPTAGAPAVVAAAAPPATSAHAAPQSSPGASAAEAVAVAPATSVYVACTTTTPPSLDVEALYPSSRSTAGQESKTANALGSREAEPQRADPRDAEHHECATRPCHEAEPLESVPSQTPVLATSASGRIVELENTNHRLRSELAEKSRLIRDMMQLQATLDARFAALEEGLSWKDGQLEVLSQQHVEACRSRAAWQSRAEQLEEEMQVLRSALLERADENVWLWQQLEASTQNSRLLHEHQAAAVAAAMAAAEARTPPRDVPPDPWAAVPPTRGDTASPTNPLMLHEEMQLQGPSSDAPHAQAGVGPDLHYAAMSHFPPQNS